jgi:hypothetical protein
MAGNPTSDIWYCPQAAIPNLGTWNGTNGNNLGTWNGTNGNTLQLAVLNVTPGVCSEINNRASGQPIAPTANDLGNFALTPATGNVAAQTSANWPASDGPTNLNLYGQPVGCVQNSNGGSSGYFFYQVLYLQ